MRPFRRCLTAASRRASGDVDRHPLGGVAADLDQHQLGAHRLLLQAVQHPGVDQRLALVHVAHRRRQLAAAAHRLDLLDHQRAVLVAAHAVGAAVHGDLPAAVAEGERQVDLAAVGAVVGELLLLVAAVDRLAEPQALIAAAVGEAEVALPGPFQQVVDRQVEGQAIAVESRSHGGDSMAWRRHHGLEAVRGASAAAGPVVESRGVAITGRRLGVAGRRPGPRPGPRLGREAVEPRVE